MVVKYFNTWVILSTECDELFQKVMGEWSIITDKQMVWAIKAMIDYKIKITKSDKSHKIMYYVHLWLLFFMNDI